MRFKGVVIFNHMIPMQIETMFSELRIMISVIWNVEMVLCKNQRFLIKWIRIRVVAVRNMYQYTNMVAC